VCGQRTTEAGHCVGRQNLTRCVLVDVSVTVVPCHMQFRLSAIVRVAVGIVERSEIG